MVAKVLLAVTLLAFSALAVNDSKLKKKLTVDPLTAKDAAESFQEALQEEEPLLKEEATKADAAHHKSLVNTLLRGPNKAQAVPIPDLASELKSGAWASDFENDVANLVLGLTKGGLASTPFDSSVVTKIADLIEKDMMPKVTAAHVFDQETINNMSQVMITCNDTLQGSFDEVNNYLAQYETESGLHKSCRKDESDLFKELEACEALWRSHKVNKTIACDHWLEGKEEYGEVNKLRVISTKAIDEDVEGFVSRITTTICGAPLDCAHCTNGVMEDGVCTHGEGFHGMYNDLVTRRQHCESNTTAFVTQTATCKEANRVWLKKQGECDVVQHNMDEQACLKTGAHRDVCGSYITCYTGGEVAEISKAQTIMQNEADRRSEWKGLEKMACLISAFATPEGAPTVTQEEIDACRYMSHDYVDNGNLNITYPAHVLETQCDHGDMYPTTSEWVAEEYTPLPGDAKGKPDSYECAGFTEVNTVPAEGSPPTCVCENVELGSGLTWSPGALVKCTNCLDVYRSNDLNSCPIGTKLFSPRTREDWTAFLDSTRTHGPLRAPDFIFDVTRAHNDITNEHIQPINSGTAANNDLPFRTRWMTHDGSPWWLHESSEAALLMHDTSSFTSYQANCYMDLSWSASDTDAHPYYTSNADDVRFNVTPNSDVGCQYHSHSYYCQTISYDFTPTVVAGVAATGCTCKKVQLNGAYSAPVLLKCEECAPIRSSEQANSCPAGTKLFAPQSREDWQTFLASASPLRAPHWIIDVTRPQNGCGEATAVAEGEEESLAEHNAGRAVAGISDTNSCNHHPFKSDQPEMATWRTRDGEPWWLRDEGSSSWVGGEEYKANCYMNLYSFHNEDNIAFETKNNTRETALPAADAAHSECEFYSSSYYCQSEFTTTTTTATPAKCDSAYTETSQCPTGHALRENLGTIECSGNPCDTELDTDDALCCQALYCDTYTCTTTDAQLKTDSATIEQGATPETACCEVLAMCSTYTGCSYALISDSATTACAGATCSASDDSTCCASAPTIEEYTADMLEADGHDDRDQCAKSSSDWGLNSVEYMDSQHDAGAAECLEFVLANPTTCNQNMFNFRGSHRQCYCFSDLSLTFDNCYWRDAGNSIRVWKITAR